MLPSSPSPSAKASLPRSSREESAPELGSRSSAVEPLSEAVEEASSASSRRFGETAPLKIPRTISSSTTRVGGGGRLGLSLSCAALTAPPGDDDEDGGGDDDLSSVMAGAAATEGLGPLTALGMHSISLRVYPLPPPLRFITT